MAQSRRPAGTPTGGQFAPTNRPALTGLGLRPPSADPARVVSENELPYPVDSSTCATCGALVWCYPWHPDEVWDFEREHWGRQSGGNVAFACEGGAAHTPSADDDANEEGT